jgi:hypothetical protein
MVLKGGVGDGDGVVGKEIKKRWRERDTERERDGILYNTL